ncbi:MarR family winged helix-turn-helix transcriptional regulator [Streptomyces endophyticus]|uniref:MarR family winged helix-turn-helix transcriptional regulator n=1 Tax=Streptomyces endophyticus TaxID=714166 RepID=A0ABU6F3L5_9ACTN|nr:MarR family winged helix-turn-helix transcriptional regulator [Streptomyces endophyticus]MEB8337422.1 MarR family winged helix-turn-helix transcriptional regulator [Streptomyces endophyticus]
MHLSPGSVDAVDAQRIEGAARGLLRGIAQLGQSLFREGDFGLTRSQAVLLDALEDGPCRVTGLAAHTGMAQPRVTVLLQKLGEAGLVERRRCEDDRRAVETSLTPAGRALLEAGRQRMAAALLTALGNGAVDDPERAVSAARDALATLLNALESEAS